MKQAKRTTIYSRESLLAYFDGKCPPEQEYSIRLYLKTPAGQQAAAELMDTDIVSQLNRKGGIAGPTPPADLRDKILREIGQRIRRGQRIRTLSRIAAAGLMLALLHGRRNPVRVSGLLRFRFEPAVMAQILRIGVPNGLENSFFQLGRVLLVSLISTFGTAQTAANAVANNIDNFGVIPGQALGLALITVVGQCVGAGDWDQVRAYTKRLVKLTYLCTWGLNAALLLGLPLILRLYSLTPETQWYAAVLIFIHNGCAMLFWPLAFTMPNALRAAGDVRVPMVISITSMLVVRVGGSYLLGLHFGLGAIGVWLAMVGDWVVRLICFVLRARKKLWLEHR